MFDRIRQHASGAFAKDRVKQYAFWAIAIDSPLIYLGAVTLDNAVLTLASLAVLGAAGALALWAY